MTASLHVPVRPDWVCFDCRTPYPCEYTIRRLLDQFRDATATLRLQMSMSMVDAAADLRDIRAGTLHERFVAWVPTR